MIKTTVEIEKASEDYHQDCLVMSTDTRMGNFTETLVINREKAEVLIKALQDYIEE